MPKESISFRSTGYFSELICDYIDQKKELSALYNRFPELENFNFQIDEKSKEFSTENRQTLFHVLSDQYNGIEISEETSLNIKRLKDSNTFTITTGHQLNLFTGPLYFLYKIISVINLCKSLKNTYPKYDFVPVYWMASEDHDFDEISFFNFKGKKVHWQRESSGAVGRLSNEGLDSVYEIFSLELGGSTNANKLKKLFKSAYLEHESLSKATLFLANELFKDYGLVILDADHRELKRQFIPQIESDVFSQTTFNSVAKTNKLLESLEYNIQVNPREINMFYLKDNLRERLVFEGGKFMVNNSTIEFSEAELKNEIASFPERFSPNVLMRPLYQECILPNLCYIGGGGELAYWLQLKENFKAHKVVFPILLLRDSVLIRTEKQFEKQQKLKLSNTDLFLSRNDFINKYVRRISNINIDFSEKISHLQSQFSDLYKLAELTDKSFIGAVKAQEVKQIKGLKALEKRLLKAQKKKLADHITRATNLQEELFPNQSLQERNTNFSQFYLEYGEYLIPELIKSLEPLSHQFAIITK